jgi:hypothetical protein
MKKLEQFRELMDFCKTLTDHRSSQVVFPSRNYSIRIVFKRM